MKRASKPRAAALRKVSSAEGDDTTIHLRLNKEDRQRLRAILGFMLQDPEADAESVSYSGALRYSMRKCVERPPAHVKHPGRGE